MTLSEFFQLHGKIAVAVSGGADSVYLMHMAKKCGAEPRGYFVKSEFQPKFEREDMRRAAREYGFDIREIELSVLDDEKIAKNSPERCYYCKKRIMSAIVAAAESDGYSIVCDGTNASDDVADRPGYRALGELGVISPLRACGITKADVRRLSREEGLFVWDKPAYACLATRIKCGERITDKKLRVTELSEDFLKRMGFSDFRVRMSEDSAKLELCPHDMKKLMENRREIMSELKKYYGSVLLDMEARDEKLFD